MPEIKDIRIDKFLWAVRLFKTRALAAEACKKGHILLNNSNVKPSRVVNVRDIIYVKNPPIYRQYEILQLLKNRVGAKLVSDYIKEVTPEDDLFKLKIAKELNKTSFGRREKGTGRPTKKERRDLNKFLGE